MLRNAYKVLHWNLGRLRRTWEDNIKMDLEGIRFEDVGRAYLRHLVNTGINS
jgi:hypothetical protein